MKRLALLGALVALLGFGISSASEQEVRAIVPKAGQQVQQVQQIGPRGEQAVRGIGGTQAQQVDRFVEPSQGQKIANNTAKAVTGVAAAATAIGATVAMLMLL